MGRLQGFERFLLVVILVARVGFAQPPDVLSLQRPKEGEWFTLTLNGVKTGYLFTRLAAGTWEGQPAMVSVEDLVLRAKTGDTQARMEKAFAPRPGGPLLGFRIDERKGTATETWVGTCSPSGVTVVRRRAFAPDETRTLPPSKETLEAADLARLAAARRGTAEAFSRTNASVERISKATFLGESPDPTVGSLVTVAWDDGEHSFSRDGRTVAIKYGKEGIMRAFPTTEALAKDIGKGVDLAAVARIPLRSPFPSSIFVPPSKVALIIGGLKESEVLSVPGRQKKELLPDGRVRVQVSSREPSLTENINASWLGDAQLKAALSPSYRVDPKHPRIIELAKRAQGAEKDAWVAAQAIAAATRRAVVIEPGLNAALASEALERGRGSRPEFVRVFVAAARASGIPAREVSGLMAVDDALYPGTWAEIFTGEWLQVDPDAGKLIAAPDHIALRDESVWMQVVIGGGVRVDVEPIKP